MFEKTLFDPTTAMGRQRWIRLSRETMDPEAFTIWREDFEIRCPPVPPEQQGSQHQPPNHHAATVPDAAVPRVDGNELFHPVEHAILRRFFKLRPQRSAPQDLAESSMASWIGIDPDLEQYGLENAVARLCLNAIQERLPQWVATRGDGSVIVARERYARTVREVEAKPVHLLTINWANSGPGIPWPVSYHATWIPGYERWVVTASADGADAWGCADIAIGAFRGTDIRAGAGQVVRKDWRSAYREYDQQPWVAFWEEGLVTEEEALAWRKRVWGRREDV